MTVGAVTALMVISTTQGGCLRSPDAVTELPSDALDHEGGLTVSVDEDLERIITDESASDATASDATASDATASDATASEATASDATAPGTTVSAVPGESEASAGYGGSAPKPLTRLTLKNTTLVARSGEPVRVGVPLPKSANITSTSQITLYDASGSAVPVQVAALARWTGAPDDTSSPLRWVLLSFAGSVQANSSASYSLFRYGTNPNPASSLSVTDDGTTLRVSTGPAVFTLSRSSADLFTGVTVGGQSLLKTGNGIILKDNAGKTYRADLSKATVTVESRGKNEAVVKITGSHVQTGSTSSLLNYTLRLSFFAGRSDVRMNYTLLNPEAATHGNNVWPMGDPGSRYLEDVSLVLPLNASTSPNYLLSAGSAPLSGVASQEIKVYQDSSGGVNYRSENHMNANRWVPITFKGYKATSGASTLTSGDRVQPWLDVSSSSGGIAVGVRQFWQNFPKALSYSSTGVRVGLFPTEFADVFEIQGGEQKTHEMHLYFHSGAGTASSIDPVMAALNTPLVAAAPAAWYQSSGAFLYEDSTREGQMGQSGTLEATFDTIYYPVGATGRSYVSQWEVIDAYGWRNFGDVMSDYETNCGKDTGSLDSPLAHYNNQYDYVAGALNMFARTLDPNFLQFAYDTARHTVDIDVYHTTLGYQAYAGGMFWHTTHDVWADTSSHRSYPMAEVSSACTPYTAGGPGLGHLYVDGLVGYYFMTGDRVAKDAVVELANYAYTRHFTYGDETDGRSLGNFLRTMVNAYRLTGDAKYYTGAVNSINSAISSRIAASDGTPWADGMLGKALGTFLDLKLERGQTSDADYTKAQSLLKSFADKVVNVSYPNDVNLTRWADVLAYAYKHCGNNRTYLDRAKTLYSTIETTYWGRGTYSHAKEVAILLNNGGLVRYYRANGL